MIQPYQGHFSYDGTTVQNWNYTLTGIYYCGYVLNGNLMPLYIGRAVGQGGIRGRLLQHLNEDYWPQITHFGYRVCTTAQEAINLETQEIARLLPAYNKQGK